MRLKVLVPYREDITYSEMEDILDEEAKKLGWSVSKTNYRPIDFQTEIVRDCSAYGHDELEKPGTTQLAISAQIHMPYHNGHGVDPHGD